MSDKRCICTMAQSMVGDGCRYCQPQEYIDRLHEQIEEDAAAVDRHAELVEALADAIEALEVAGEWLAAKTSKEILDCVRNDTP